MAGSWDDCSCHVARHGEMALGHCAIDVPVVDPCEKASKNGPPNENRVGEGA